MTDPTPEHVVPKQDEPHDFSRKLYNETCVCGLAPEAPVHMPQEVNGKSTFRSKICIIDGLVYMALPNGLFFRMTPNEAQGLGKVLISRGAQAEGRSGHLVIMEVPDEPGS